LKEKLEALKVSVDGIEMPKGATPYTNKFRDISAATLKHFGAFYTHDVEKLQDRIIFPITDISNKTIVYVARHTLSEAQPRYVNYPSGVVMPIFPAKAPENTTNMVLVEGIFDMLNLYDKGLHNVSCTFGTNTLKNNTGRKLLAFKVQGITKIFLLFDGDKAGRESAKELKPLLEAEGFLVEIIDLPDDTDPGTMSQEDVTSMREYTK
jgi:DNA primase